MQTVWRPSSCTSGAGTITRHWERQSERQPTRGFASFPSGFLALLSKIVLMKGNYLKLWPRFKAYDFTATMKRSRNQKNTMRPKSRLLNSSRFFMTATHLLIQIFPAYLISPNGMTNGACWSSTHAGRLSWPTSGWYWPRQSPWSSGIQN